MDALRSRPGSGMISERSVSNSRRAVERMTMSEAGSPLRVERASDRIVATLDRPATRNAIDQQLVDELHALCEELEDEPRVLILTGADGVFASGADIGQLRERRAEDARKG